MMQKEKIDVKKLKKYKISNQDRQYFQINTIK
jgi:hypothetical protein